jgi:hypothetical protein
LIFEDEEEARDHVAHQVLRAEANRQPRNAGASQDRQQVDGQLTEHHQDPDEPRRHAHDIRENPPERRRSSLPFEIGLRVPVADLVLQVLDRQLRRVHHDYETDDNDDEVDAVDEEPAAEQARIPPRLDVAQARQCQRHARERRDAVRKKRQRADQLLGARVNSPPVLGAHDVGGLDESVNHRAGDADEDRRGGERKHRGTNGCVLKGWDHRRRRFK